MGSTIFFSFVKLYYAIFVSIIVLYSSVACLIWNLNNKKNTCNSTKKIDHMIKDRAKIWHVFRFLCHKHFDKIVYQQKKKTFRYSGPVAWIPNDHPSQILILKITTTHNWNLSNVSMYPHSLMFVAKKFVSQEWIYNHHTMWYGLRVSKMTISISCLFCNGN